MRCTESEDSSDLSSENLFQQQPVFDSPFVFFLFVFDVHTLPTAQVPSALTDSFSRGHDPFAHACKARPLTIVGWTSLSVSLSLSLSQKERIQALIVKYQDSADTFLTPFPTPIFTVQARLDCSAR